MFFRVQTTSISKSVLQRFELLFSPICLNTSMLGLFKQGPSKITKTSAAMELKPCNWWSNKYWLTSLKSLLVPSSHRKIPRKIQEIFFLKNGAWIIMIVFGRMAFGLLAFGRTGCNRNQSYISYQKIQWITFIWFFKICMINWFNSAKAFYNFKLALT